MHQERDDIKNKAQAIEQERDSLRDQIQAKQVEFNRQIESLEAQAHEEEEKRISLEKNLALKSQQLESIEISKDQFDEDLNQTLTVEKIIR